MVFNKNNNLWDNKKSKSTRFVKGQIPWNKGINMWKNKEHPKGTLGKHFSEETKKIMSNSHKGKKRLIKLFGKENPFYGKHHSEETKIKISLTKSGDKEFTGFKTPIYRIVQVNPKWKEWRRKVFERDNWTCQDCGGKGYLHPHHIVPVKDCLKMDFEELIFDVENGLTLCKDCHLGKGIHKGVN